FNDTSETHGVAFSPDGKQLIASAGLRNADVLRWDTRTYDPLLTLQSLTRLERGGRTGIVYGVAVSKDGRYITSGYDLWDAQDGTRISTLENKGFVQAVAFSPDTKLLALDGNDKRIVLWELGLQSWQRRACRMAGRDLTQAEWIEF